MIVLAFLLCVYLFFILTGKFWDRFLFARAWKVAAGGVAPAGYAAFHTRGGRVLVYWSYLNKGVK